MRVTLCSHLKYHNLALVVYSLHPEETRISFEQPQAQSRAQPRAPACLLAQAPLALAPPDPQLAMTATSTAARTKTRFSSRNLSAVYKAPVAKASDHAGGFHGAGRMLVLKSGGRQSPAVVAPAPINTPSLRKENNGQDVHVNLVPTGRSGWGSAGENQVDDQAAAPVEASVVPATTPESEPPRHTQLEKSGPRAAHSQTGDARAIARVATQLGGSFPGAHAISGRWGDDAVEQDIVWADMMRVLQHERDLSHRRDANYSECASRTGAQREAWPSNQRAATKLFPHSNQLESQDGQDGCHVDRFQSTQHMMTQARSIYRPSDARFDGLRHQALPHKQHSERIDSHNSSGIPTHQQIEPHRADSSTIPLSNQHRDGTPPRRLDGAADGAHAQRSQSDHQPSSAATACYSGRSAGASSTGTSYTAQSTPQQSFANRSTVAAPPVRILKRDGPRMLFDPKTGTMVNAEVKGTPGRGLRLASSTSPSAPMTPSKVRSVASSSPGAAAAVSESISSGGRSSCAHEAPTTREVGVQHADRKTSAVTNAEKSAPRKQNERVQVGRQKRALKLQERVKLRKRGMATSTSDAPAPPSSKSSVGKKPSGIPDEDCVAVSRTSGDVDALKQVPESGGVVVLTDVLEGATFPLDDPGERFETVRSRRALLLERKTLREKASAAVALAVHAHQQHPKRSSGSKPGNGIVISAPHRSSKRALVVGVRATRKTHKVESLSQPADTKVSPLSQSSPLDTAAPAKDVSKFDSDAHAKPKNEKLPPPASTVARRASTRGNKKASNSASHDAIASKEPNVTEKPVATKRVYRVKKTEGEGEDASLPQQTRVQTHSAAAKSGQLDGVSGKHRNEQTLPPKTRCQRLKPKSSITKLDSLRSTSPCTKRDGTSSPSPREQGSVNGLPAKDRRTSRRSSSATKPKNEQQHRDATTDQLSKVGDTVAVTEVSVISKRSERRRDENEIKAKAIGSASSRAESTSPAKAAVAKAAPPAAEVRNIRSKPHKLKPKLATSTTLQESSPSTRSHKVIASAVNSQTGDAPMVPSMPPTSEAPPTKTHDRIDSRRSRKWSKKTPSAATESSAPAPATSKASSAAAAAVSSDPTPKPKSSGSLPSFKKRPSKSSNAPPPLVPGGKSCKRVYVAKSKPPSAGGETPTSSAA